MSRKLDDKLWSKVEVTANCWQWLGGNNGNGYGQLRVKGRNAYAHRFFYESLVGPIPQGLQIDHLCRNRSCVNPSHLEPVTQQENVRRGLARFNGGNNRAKASCPQGHPYSGSNLYLNPQGSRECRACNRAKAARYRARKKECVK